MKCSSCGHWNRVPVNKIFIEQNSPEPKVKVFIPTYEPLEIVNCKKCRKVIAKLRELIRIVDSHDRKERDIQRLTLKQTIKNQLNACRFGQPLAISILV